MKNTIRKLLANEVLSEMEAEALMYEITDIATNDAQIVAAITSLMHRNVQLQELKGFRNALLKQAVIPLINGDNAIDLCGTGGDAKNTFNISTLSAVVVAAAGYKVVKHGNYGVSSFCGSSTILESLGYEFTADEDLLNEQLTINNICFLHAPLFHPCLKRVGQIRQDLGVPTFFNFLGPLVNPVQPKYQLTGVYNLNIARMYREILEDEREGFKVVHSLDGYDEVSLTGAFKILGKTTDSINYPDELKQKTLAPQQLHGGNNLEESKTLFLDILSGRGTIAQQSVVLVNSAYAIQCFNASRTFEDCYAEAEETLLSGKAFLKIKSIIALSKSKASVIL